jgi:hypothetical protein
MDDRILEEQPGWSLAWSDEFDGTAGSALDRPAGGRRSVGTAEGTRSCSTAPIHLPRVSAKFRNVRFIGL